MITGLDHAVILVSDIAAGELAYQTLFARTPAWRNTGDGADRVLFTLDNMTLELMSANGDGATQTGFVQSLRSRARGWRASVFEPVTLRKCIAGSIGSR